MIEIKGVTESNLDLNLQINGQPFEANVLMPWYYIDDQFTAGNPTPLQSISEVYDISTKTFTLRPVPVLIPIQKLLCINLNVPGSIQATTPSSNNEPFDPGNIISMQDAAGGTSSSGDIEYQWQMSTDDTVTFTDIPGATGSEYNPPHISETTWFRRGAKRANCINYLYTDAIPIRILIPNCDDCEIEPDCNGKRNIRISCCKNSIEVEVLGNDVSYIKVQQFNPYQEWMLCNKWNRSKEACQLNGKYSINVPDGSYTLEIMYTDNSVCYVNDVEVSNFTKAKNSQNKHEFQQLSITEHSFNIFPNPAKQEVYLEVGQNWDYPIQVEIHNTLGQVVQSKQILDQINGPFAMNLNNFN